MVSKPFSVEKVITSGVNVRKLPATTTNLFNVMVSALENGFMRVANVGKPVESSLTLFSLGELTR